MEGDSKKVLPAKQQNKMTAATGGATAKFWKNTQAGPGRPTPPRQNFTRTFRAEPNRGAGARADLSSYRFGLVPIWIERGRKTNGPSAAKS